MEMHLEAGGKETWMLPCLSCDVGSEQRSKVFSIWTRQVVVIN